MNSLANSLYQLYQQFLPIAKKCEIQLDLDLGKAADVQIEASDELMQEIGDELTSALTRSQDTHLSITASYNHIKLHDPDTVFITSHLSSSHYRSRPRYITRRFRHYNHY